MQPKRRVRKRPSKPSETLRVWRRKSCHLDDESIESTLRWFHDVLCVLKIITYYFKYDYTRCNPLKRKMLFEMFHASALSHRFEKGRCKSIEVYRSTTLKLLIDVLLRIVLNHSSIWHVSILHPFGKQALEKGGWADLVKQFLELSHSYDFSVEWSQQTPLSSPHHLLLHDFQECSLIQPREKWPSAVVISWWFISASLFNFSQYFHGILNSGHTCTLQIWISSWWLLFFLAVGQLGYIQIWINFCWSTINLNHQR